MSEKITKGNFNFSITRAKYSFAVKGDLGKIISDMKDEAKSEKDRKRVYTKVVRQHFPDLKNVKSNDRAFLAALQLHSPTEL